jgi:hypothetical protein
MPAADAMRAHSSKVDKSRVGAELEGGVRVEARLEGGFKLVEVAVGL